MEEEGEVQSFGGEGVDDDEGGSGTSALSDILHYEGNDEQQKVLAAIHQMQQAVIKCQARLSQL